MKLHKLYHRSNNDILRCYLKDLRELCESTKLLGKTQENLL